jgi:hypothetical protein
MQPEAPRREACTPGFTLLELIIVLVFVVLILGLGTLFFANVLPSARLGATGREIAATIRQLRALAQNQGEDKVLTLDLDTGQYGLEGGHMRQISPEISVRVEDPTLGDVRRGKYQILFYATGLVEGGRIVLWRNGKVLTISMDPIIGAVTLRQ